MKTVIIILTALLLCGCGGECVNVADCHQYGGADVPPHRSLNAR